MVVQSNREKLVVALQQKLDWSVGCFRGDDGLAKIPHAERLIVHPLKLHVGSDACFEGRAIPRDVDNGARSTSIRASLARHREPNRRAKASGAGWVGMFERVRCGVVINQPITALYNSVLRDLRGNLVDTCAEESRQS